MPLGEREGDTSNARFCGMEIDFEQNMPEVLETNLTQGGFDFLVAPLMNPAIRPSIVRKRHLPEYIQYAGTDLKVKPLDWHDRVVGKISSWIDLDSEDEAVRKESETVLKQEIAWASYLTVQACLLPTPKGNSCVNYARCVNQILQDQKDMKLLLRIPLGNPDDGPSESSTNLVDSWETWNSFRLLCEHHRQLFIVLDHLGSLPSENSIKRWFGESVVAAIIHTDSFITTARVNTKYLSKRLQKLITDFFANSIQVIIAGKKAAPDRFSALQIEERHPLRPYLDYVSYLYQRMGPLPDQERLEFGIRDILQSPSKPIMDYSEAFGHESSEKNAMKYLMYMRAIRKALLDRVPQKKASEVTTILMVVGAGRGPLVRMSIQAAKESKRTIKVYAVEKNINTAAALKDLIMLNKWENSVTIVSRDVRYWDAPETVDILVNDLVGSFGDNELSPECLDAAQRFLKEDGISIPSSYTSFLQPVTAPKLYNDVMSRDDILNSETACAVKMHRVARLAPCQPVFTFTHPNHGKQSNQRYKKLHFSIPKDIGSAMIHGFAGFFDATLYQNFQLGNEPSRSTVLNSCFPIFFPLRTPIRVDGGSTLEVHFWRCSDHTKMWYEWCVASPSPTPIHNCNGRSYWVSF